MRCELNVSSKILRTLWYPLSVLAGFIVVTIVAALSGVGILNRQQCTTVWRKFYSRYLYFCPHNFLANHRGSRIPVSQIAIGYYDRKIQEWYLVLEAEAIGRTGTFTFRSTSFKTDDECRKCPYRLNRAIGHCPMKLPKGENLSETQ